jgi:hypothetical protein
LLGKLIHNLKGLQIEWVAVMEEARESGWAFKEDFNFPGHTFVIKDMN